MIQLGTRWRFGDEPPASVDAALRAVIVDVEREVRGTGVDEGRAEDGSWTLTWLEGRPIATLDLVTAAGETLSVTQDVRGEAVVVRSAESEDEGW